MTNSRDQETDREATCADRIEAHMTARAEHLGSLYRIVCGDDSPEAIAAADMDETDDPIDDARDAIHMLPLSVETTKTIRVLLSTGGPADGLNVDLDRDGNVSRVVYWFADWFDHAETVVTDEDSPLWMYAEELAEYEREIERSIGS